jgi:hypothetical protein
MSLFYQLRDNGQEVVGAIFITVFVIIGPLIGMNMIVAVVVTNIQNAYKEMRQRREIKHRALDDTSVSHRHPSNQMVASVAITDVPPVIWSQQTPLQIPDFRHFSVEALENYYLCLIAIEENLKEHLQLKAKLWQVLQDVQHLNMAKLPDNDATFMGLDGDDGPMDGDDDDDDDEEIKGGQADALTMKMRLNKEIKDKAAAAKKRREAAQAASLAAHAQAIKSPGGSFPNSPDASSAANNAAGIGAIGTASTRTRRLAAGTTISSPSGGGGGGGGGSAAIPLSIEKRKSLRALMGKRDDNSDLVAWPDRLINSLRLRADGRLDLDGMAADPNVVGAHHSPTFGIHSVRAAGGIITSSAIAAGSGRLGLGSVRPGSGMASMRTSQSRLGQRTKSGLNVRPASRSGLPPPTNNNNAPVVTSMRSRTPTLPAGISGDDGKSSGNSRRFASSIDGGATTSHHHVHRSATGSHDISPPMETKRSLQLDTSSNGTQAVAAAGAAVRAAVGASAVTGMGIHSTSRGGGLGSIGHGGGHQSTGHNHHPSNVSLGGGLSPVARNSGQRSGQQSPARGYPSSPASSARPSAIDQPQPHHRHNRSGQQQTNSGNASPSLATHPHSLAGYHRLTPPPEDHPHPF